MTQQLNEETLRTLIRFFRAERKVFEEIGASEEIRKAFDLILTYLSAATVDDIIAGRPPKRYTTASRKIKLPSPDAIGRMTLEEIEALTTNEASKRKILEEIAVIRFAFPKGSLRSLKNVGLLREKILSRIQNERAHQTISEIAKGTRT